MSGSEQLSHTKVRQINFNGTSNVLSAAKSQGIKILIYTSTTNVVFGGKPLIDQEIEKLEYFPEKKFVDVYSLTKCLAEKLVREANSDKMSTCAIRPAGIYGEGEERHLPRIVNHIKSGLFCFKIGSPKNKVDFVYVDNLVHGHLLAAQKLLKEFRENNNNNNNNKNKNNNNKINENENGNKNKKIKKKELGEVYFISDGESINNFEFFKPLILHFGRSYPKISIPTIVMFYLAFLVEIAYKLGSRIYDFEPLLTRAEVYKVGVSHYFKIDKAKNELGYKPLVSMKVGMQRVLEYYTNLEQTQKNTKKSRTSPKILGILLILIFVIFSVIFYLLFNN